MQQHAELVDVARDARRLAGNLFRARVAQRVSAQPRRGWLEWVVANRQHFRDAEVEQANRAVVAQGVELGQFIALGAILIAMAYWRQTAAFTRQAFASNVVIMTCGFVLMGYQLTGYFLE
jgi:hypothetical protein